MPRLSGLPESELFDAILERRLRYRVPADPAAILERALSYPYAVPDTSYVLVGREVVPVESFDASEQSAWLDDRHVVLAYGSNISPEALIRKFARSEEETERLVLPVFIGEVEGFDVAYSAHISTYGSLPATIRHAAEVTTRASVTLLTDAQLVRMMETEFDYSLQGLTEAPFKSPHFSCEEFKGFVSCHGCFASEEGETVSLEAVPAIGRDPDVLALTQREAQHTIRPRLAPDEELDDLSSATSATRLKGTRSRTSSRRNPRPF